MKITRKITVIAMLAAALFTMGCERKGQETPTGTTPGQQETQRPPTTPPQETPATPTTPAPGQETPPSETTPAPGTTPGAPSGGGQ
jgi:hypothetical protein